MSLTVYLGSMSPVKVRAVKTACRLAGIDADIVAEEAPSGVPLQPVGCDEMRLGARNRAVATRRNHPDSIVIGIESGIFNFTGNVWVDEAAIVVICRDGNSIEGKTRPVEIPSWVIAEVMRKGPDSITAGEVLADAYGCSSTDPHSHLTRGHQSRQDLIAKALVPLLERAVKGDCD
jgi:non-canonical (house-cleaning) NTP pyrophosphatase